MIYMELSGPPGRNIALNRKGHRSFTTSCCSVALAVAVVLTLNSAASAHGTTSSAPAQTDDVSENMNGITSLTVLPSPVDWGGTATGTVQLMNPAPKDEKTTVNGVTSVKKAKTVTVTLKSSSTSVKVPSSVKVPQGALTVTFKVTVSRASACAAGPASPLTATITATYQNTATAFLKVGLNQETSRYNSQTISMDFATAQKALLGISHDGLALVFDASAPCVSSIAKGKVLILKRLGVLKVLGTKTAPQNHVAVAIGPAAFTDFIQEGTFQIFSQQLGSASMPKGFGTPAGPASLSGPDQWKYQVAGSGSGTGTIQYSFSASKDVGGMTGNVSASGDVQGGYNFLAVIHGGKIQAVKYTTPTNGKLHVSWTVQITGANSGIGESRLKMPALWSGLVDSADDIPLLFQLYANLIFKPGFGEKKAMVKGEFDLTYDGEGGFDTTQPVNEGMAAKADVPRVTAVALAAHGVVVAVNAPKLVLSLSPDSFLEAAATRDSKALGGAGLADRLEKQLGQYYTPNSPSSDFFKLNRAAYVMWVASIAYAGPGSVSMLPCQQFYETFIASAGVDQKLLGTNQTAPPDKGLQIFKDGKTVVDPDIPVCQPK